MTSSKKTRVMVVGLDGVPYTLLQKFFDQGIMPTMAEIAAQGTLRQMHVAIPEISAVNWTSFMTGANPGEHGIFGFTDLKPRSYKLHYPNYKDCRAPALWDKLEVMDKVSVVINQPATYPAKPINGVLVSGFVAIEMRKSVTPISLLPTLQRLSYKIDIDTMKSREDHEHCLKDLNETLNGRFFAMETLLDKEPWDYFEIVITGTDRLQHYLWHALEDEKHALHGPVIEYYNRVDKFVKRAFNRFREIAGGDRPEENFFLLSDHGFTALKQEVYLNMWLKQEGYLAFNDEKNLIIENMSESTRAFALDPGRIYLNMKGKYPRGSVEDWERDSLLTEISTKLKQLSYNGDKVIKEIYRNEDIYSGPFASRGPDLVALPQYGYDLKSSVQEAGVFDKKNLSGMHTQDDAFFWSVEETPDNFHITQISDMILSRFE